MHLVGFIARIRIALFLKICTVRQPFKNIPTLNETRRTRIAQSFSQSMDGLWTIEELLPHSITSRLYLMRSQLPNMWYRWTVELQLSESKGSN